MPAPDDPCATAATRPLRWRDPVRGKHHLSDDGQFTLCGTVVPGYWETEGARRWADEDGCLRCLGRSVNA